MWPEPPSPAALDAAIRRGHQDDGVREKRIAKVAIGLAVVLPLILVCVWLQYKAMARARYRGLTAPTLIAPQSQPQEVMPEPRLIVVSGEGLAELRAQEDAELNTYGWIDRRSNIVRIPIQRAMELIAQRGLPARGSNVNNIGASEYDLLIERSRQRQEAPIKEAK
jgi:hypothetical protein